MQAQNSIVTNNENAKRGVSDQAMRRSHVENWKKSGLKMSAYCRQQGLAISSFSAWTRALKPKPGFKPISIKHAPPLLAATQENMPNKIEIVVDERIKIRLLNVTNALLIANIVKELIKCN